LKVKLLSYSQPTAESTAVGVDNVQEVALAGTRALANIFPMVAASVAK